VSPPNASVQQATHDDERSLSQGVRTFGGLTVLSRAAGLLRDAVTVRVFGDSAVGSAFAAALAIPNLFRRLFGEGALAAAFLPEYVRADQHDHEVRDRLASVTLALVAAVTGAIAVVGELALLAVLLMAPPNPDRDLSLRLIMVTLPFMPLICTAAILGAMLQAHGRFAPGAAAPIILNLCMIAASALHFAGPGLDRVHAAYAIGGSAVVAGMLQVLWCGMSVRGIVSFKRSRARAGEHTRRMLTRFFPMLLGLGTIQLNALLDTVLAMWPSWVGETVAGIPYPLDERSNAILGYTQRLYQFPLGVFGIAVATAVFPLLARTARDRDRFAATLARAIRLSAFIGVPASIGLILVRHDLTRVVFAGGERGFSEAGLDRAAAVLLGYAVAIWAYSLNHVLTRAFYARGQTMTPVKIAAGAVGLNLILNVALMWPLREAGLAWSTAISAMAQTIVLARVLSGHHGAHVRIGSELMLLLRRAAMPLGAMVLSTTTVMLFWSEPLVWGWAAARLAAVSTLGVGIYLWASRLARLPELDALLPSARIGALPVESDDPPP